MSRESTVGPFAIDSEIGRGGMARVFSARHLEAGSPVALKILFPEVAASAAFTEAFRLEVQAAARLDHPRIVAVYDHGVSGPGDQTDGDVPVGCPWLAMELVEGGSARSLVGQLPWPDLRGILLGVLDGLAHAHARGVVHRDIKPANVLIEPRNRGVKLTDFGLAHSIRSETSGPAGDEVLGTPNYMAPEQIECRWQDFGPWTDLYSLGAMAWTLATGQPPYKGRVADILVGHLNGHLPDFNPAEPVPPGFLEWIEGLMATPTQSRFQRAADAAWALVRLGDLGGQPIARASLRGTALSTLALPPAPSTKRRRSWWGRGEASQQVKEGGSRPAVDAGRAPMPKDWRARRATRRHLHGAGLALFGQRSIGLVGRTTERDRLWSMLGETRSARRPHLVLLEGPAGSGKSALAAWLAERADEVGAAQFLSASHSEGQSPSDGLGPMLSRHLRFFDLSRADIVQRAARELNRLGESDRDEAVALAELAVPSSEEELQATGLGARFSGPRERHALLTRYLARLAEHRPVVLWLDDLPFGPDSQRFVADLLLSDLESPILVLATSRSEALAEDPARARAIQALAELPRAERLSLGPLDRDAQAALVRELLGLEPDLAAQVEGRSGGNPLFAVQLVGDWVARNLLVAGDQGYRLAEGVKAGFPEGLLGVWEARIEQLLEGRDEAESLALELAAVGGQSVEATEWAAVCEAAGYPVPHALLEELLRLRLAVPTPTTDGWRFVHGMLREALVYRASQAGRLARDSSLWADILEDQADAVVRRARHLVAAGRVDEAPEPLGHAVVAELRHGEFGRAAELLELRKQALQQVDLSELDPPRIMGKILESRLLRRTGKLQGSYDLGKSALAQARKCGDVLVLVNALAALGNTAVSVGEVEESERALGEALELARQEGWTDQAASISSNLAFVLMRQGRHGEAMKVFREAAFVAEADGDSIRVASCYSMLARCHFQSGEVERSAFLLEEARLRFQHLGARWGLATVANTRGELARAAGQLESAETAYREAAERFDACGSGDGVFSRLNVGLSLAERGKPGRALRIFDEVEQELQRSGRAPVVSALHAIRLFPLAALGRWRRVSSALELAEEALREVGMVDIDLGRFAHRAAALCDEAGKSDLARRAWTIARDQWRAMGRTELEAEAQAHL